ncbi:MAG: DUF6962 family protein [Spirochaetales bacterium]
MPLTEIATEQTTAVTNVLLALLAIYVVRDVRRHGSSSDRRKTKIWSFAFTCLAIAAGFGAVAHGFEFGETVNFWLWQPIYFMLGLTVSMFFVGVVYDLRNFSIPGWLSRLAVLAAIAFYAVTALGPAPFILFIAFEGIALLVAFFGYLVLTLRGRVRGSGFMLLGVLTSIAAAAIQATEVVSFTFLFEFDHNGVFHLVQMPAILFLMYGLRAELRWRIGPGGSVASSAITPPHR